MKRILSIDKVQDVLVTNDGWLVSKAFLMPLSIKRQLNIAGEQ